MSNTIKQRVDDLFDTIHNFVANDGLCEACRLGNGCYILDDRTVLSRKSNYGKIRYPYSCDGLILWAHDSGDICAQESLLTVLIDNSGGKEPSVAFFVGKKTADGYDPISVTGIARQPKENVRRYTVFSPTEAYYLTECDGFSSAVRVYVDESKRMRFTLFLQNDAQTDFDGYLSAYFDLFMFHEQTESFENKWYKSCSADPFGYIYRTRECTRSGVVNNYARILRTESHSPVLSTTSRLEFSGGSNRQLYCAEALFTGNLPERRSYTEFTESAISADIMPVKLAVGECATLSYAVSVCSDQSGACKTNADTSIKDEENDYDRLVRYVTDRAALPQIEFSDLPEYGLSGEKFTWFIRNVMRQTEFCARAKNYAGPYIGIRDIYQQLESTCMWMPKYTRSKMLEALNFIGEDGRAPRQYSYPRTPETPPDMDLRMFVDQGLWIIHAFYVYLCFTGDFSALEEQCGYYKLGKTSVGISDKRDSALDHLLRIADFLIDCVDPRTHCLRALYGDWNDALDGLGKTSARDKEYGDGVSVMASLQLCAYLKELAKIAERCDLPERQRKYLAAADEIENGLIANAVTTDGWGNRKILHGWGEGKSFLVGSFDDFDGASRDSLTSNAFWIISGMLERDKTLKKEILDAYRRLDSKYGLKTFEPCFSEEYPQAGRIAYLPEGTAENSAVYIHAAMFAIQSLFIADEPQFAWEQLVKILPITHDRISVTPFVMPNSYAFNEKKGFDGESMNDWFTGSACVLIKIIVRNVFGVDPDLNGLHISPARKMPFEKASLKLNYKKRPLTVEYINKGVGVRSVAVNGVPQKGDTYLTDEELPSELYVSITD